MSDDRQQEPNPPVQPQQAPVCLSAAVVSGSGETEVLQRILLDVGILGTAAIAAGALPSDFVGNLIEVVLLSQRVSIEACEAFHDKVLINGVLHKNLLFKLAPVDQPDLTGVSLDEADCSLIVSEPMDVSIDCPFGACVPVTGACPGDQCVVETACVDAVKELLIDIDGDGLADQFEQKDCVLLRVRTLRGQQLTVTPGANTCPQFPPVSICQPTSCLGGTPGGLPSTTLMSRSAS